MTMPRSITKYHFYICNLFGLIESFKIMQRFRGFTFDDSIDYFLLHEPQDRAVDFWIDVKKFHSRNCFEYLKKVCLQSLSKSTDDFALKQNEAKYAILSDALTHIVSSISCDYEKEC